MIGSSRDRRKQRYEWYSRFIDQDCKSNDFELPPLLPTSSATVRSTEEREASCPLVDDADSIGEHVDVDSLFVGAYALPDPKLLERQQPENSSFRTISVENYQLKKERIIRAAQIREMETGNSMSFLGSCKDRLTFDSPTSSDDDIFTHPIFYSRSEKFNCVPSDERDLSSSLADFFTLMCDDSREGDLCLYAIVGSRHHKVCVCFQTVIPSYVQSLDGTVFLTDERYTFFAISDVTDAHRFQGRLFFRVNKKIISFDSSEAYKMCREQVYDRTVWPNRSDDQQERHYFHAVNCGLDCVLKPVLVDSKGREVIGCFRQKEFVERFLFMDGLRFEHPSSLKRARTEEGCHLRFEVQNESLCLAFRMYPVKMCNSFHMLCSSIKSARSAKKKPTSPSTSSYLRG